METGTIYSILCKVNGMRYIGQTKTSVSQRWASHLAESKQKSHRPLYRAIKKYGQGMFTIREIETDVPLSKLSEREMHWIEQFDTFNNGYNLTSGGEESYTIREDVREKIASSMSGKIKSDEHIQSIRDSLKKRGDTFSVKGDGKHHRTKIRGTHIETGEIVEYNSLTDACADLGLKNSNLSRGIKCGYRVGDYKWEKIGDKTINQPIYGKRILDGKIIHHFSSMREAGRVLGTGDDGGIRKALKNPSRYSWKGCRWYKESGKNERIQ